MKTYQIYYFQTSDYDVEYDIADKVLVDANSYEEAEDEFSMLHLGHLWCIEEHEPSHADQEVNLG